MLSVDGGGGGVAEWGLIRGRVGSHGATHDCLSLSHAPYCLHLPCTIPPSSPPHPQSPHGGIHRHHWTARDAVFRFAQDSGTVGFCRRWEQRALLSHHSRLHTLIYSFFSMFLRTRHIPSIAANLTGDHYLAPRSRATFFTSSLPPFLPLFAYQPNSFPSLKEILRIYYFIAPLRKLYFSFSHKDIYRVRILCR